MTVQRGKRGVTLFVVVALAKDSRGVSFVWGPLTHKNAQGLHDALYKYGERLRIEPGGIYPLHAPGLTERVFVAGVCIFDPTDKKAAVAS